MFQVKLFKNVESDISALEQDINAWLAKTKVRPVQVFGNIAPQSGGGNAAGAKQGLTQSAFAPSDVLIAIVFEQT